MAMLNEPAPEHDPGGRDVDSGSGNVAERGGLYARTWTDDEPEPRPPHPAPTEPARPADRDEWPKALTGLAGKLGIGWHVLQVRRSVGHYPLSRAPWFRPEPVPSIVAMFRHGDVRAHGIWTGKQPNEHGAIALAFDTARVWHVCTDPTCPRSRGGGGSHPADTPAAITSPELRSLLSQPPDHVTADRDTWRAP